MRTLMRLDPVNFVNEINRLFETKSQTEGDFSNVETSQWIPAVDIKEDKNQFCILADLPGLDKEDINIAMENNILTINGVRENQNDDHRANYYRTERIRGSFYRRFSLPDTADGSKIKAKINKGVLEITIAKKEQALPKFIKIE